MLVKEEEKKKRH